MLLLLMRMMMMMMHDGDDDDDDDDDDDGEDDDELHSAISQCIRCSSDQAASHTDTLMMMCTLLFMMCTLLLIGVMATSAALSTSLREHCHAQMLADDADHVHVSELRHDARFSCIYTIILLCQHHVHACVM